MTKQGGAIDAPKGQEARALLAAMNGVRSQFLALVADVRPALHRYCTRMTGSIFDGEDLVQTTLAAAYDALGKMTEPPPLRPWLFRIAHNAWIDFLKRYDRAHVDMVAEVPEPNQPAHELMDDAVDVERMEAALAVVVRLPPVQRSAFILKDVLEHSLDEVAHALDTTVGAVKAALSRARANVGSAAAPPQEVSALSAQDRSNLAAYITLFNQRDWNGLRSLLGRQAQLDLVSRLRQPALQAKYFENYVRVLSTEDLRAAAGFVGATPVIAMFRDGAAEPAYFVLLTWEAGRVSSIRDYYYVPYIAQDQPFSVAMATDGNGTPA